MTTGQYVDKLPQGYTLAGQLYYTDHPKQASQPFACDMDRQGDIYTAGDGGEVAYVHFTQVLNPSFRYYELVRK